LQYAGDQLLEKHGEIEPNWRIYTTVFSLMSPQEQEEQEEQVNNNNNNNNNNKANGRRNGNAGKKFHKYTGHVQAKIYVGTPCI
jgi:hypothetical protein